MRLELNIKKLSGNMFFGISLFVVCLGVGGIAGCNDNKAEEQAKNEIILPVYRIDTATAVITKDFLGTIEGKVNVEIRAQVEGLLDEIFVDEGDFVQKGQKLFRINPLAYQELWNNAIAKENVEKARLANALIEMERIKPLVENEVISTVRLRKAESDYEVAKASLTQATAAVASARINLDFATITAPVSGYIGRIPKRIGNLVSGRDSEPITVLTDVDEVYVYFSLSESDFYYFVNHRDNSTKNIQFDSLKNSTFLSNVTLLLANGTVYPHTGIVDAVAGQVNRNTGSVSVRATFPNKDNILRSGNTGTLKMQETQPGVILIPQEATTELQDKIFVTRLDEAYRAVKQPVKIAGAANNLYIVSEGLEKGDMIIVEGFDKISEGTHVTPLFKNDIVKSRNGSGSRLLSRVESTW